MESGNSWLARISDLCETCNTAQVADPTSAGTTTQCGVGIDRKGLSKVTRYATHLTVNAFPRAYVFALPRCCAMKYFSTNRH